MQRARPFAALLLGGCLAACAVSGEPRGADDEAAIAIDGVVIRNQLAYAVTDVMIEVPATGAFAGCGTVLQRSECSNRFGAIDYRAHPMQVSWREHGQRQTTGEFEPERPDDLQPGRPARVEIIIFSPGQAGARLVQP